MLQDKNRDFTQYNKPVKRSIQKVFLFLFKDISLISAFDKNNCMISIVHFKLGLHLQKSFDLEMGKIHPHRN